MSFVNVIFVSQCEKKALNRTRRVLDAFANRIGDRTWQTVITEDGLIAVKTLLRKIATKNTSVACHWIRSRSRRELVWIVGKRDKFNEHGIVPVNNTKINFNHREWEKGWYSTEIIALASSIAGLFHDFGKANCLFQNKLNPKIISKTFEPYRHEWISLRLFQAFVNTCSDEQWINNLSNVNDEFEKQLLEKIIIDGNKSPFNNPFTELPKFAKIISWLIVSHHRLPVYPYDKNNPPCLTKANEWLNKHFDNLWNSPKSFDDNWTERELKDNWELLSKTPLASKTWQEKASSLSKRASRCLNQINNVDNDSFDQPFIIHISRLVLMLSDHYYSAMDATNKWQDINYNAYANTDKNKQQKQKLDEHNVGVAHYAYVFAKILPRLRDELLSVNDNKILAKGLGGGKEFLWQDWAYRMAQSIQKSSQEQGFFGINMASTGKGKTIANARIIYGLSDEKEGCRFSVAIGLRTLTLQTGASFKEKLKLDESDIATLIGSQAVQRLYQPESSTNKSECSDNDKFITQGSESLDIGLDDGGCEIKYDVEPQEGWLKKWFGNNPKAQKLLHAPILVSTIDHLTPATEGVRGGRQIVPMLRLLTSDLVLDEPDELGLHDLPALTRLVNWVGMLGGKVLISTATMPPVLVYALFEAYHEGRKSFNAAISQNKIVKPIICAWFDEFGSETSEQQDIQSFRKRHDEFVNRRIANLNQEALILRKAKLVCIPKENNIPPIRCMSEVIQQSIIKLHEEHNQIHKSGKKISIGLVRIANINPLVAVARYLYETAAPDNFKIRYCVYHSHYPLAQRALIEKKLDQVLNRKNSEAIWNVSEIQQAITKGIGQNHLFVVLATSVAEIGRDHDYDWAIAEPSSMRSIIQLSGRIQRHRKQEPITENLFILAKNFKALQCKEVAFEKPGFEASSRKLTSHDLQEILENAQYAKPTAIPSIQPLKITRKKSEFSNLLELEHTAYCEELFGNDKQGNNARLWWKNQATWCAEIQRRQPFRNSQPDQAYCYYIDEDLQQPIWKIKNENVYPTEYKKTSDITLIDVEPAKGNQPWFEIEDIQNNYEDLAERFNLSLKAVSHCFGEVRLPEYKNKSPRWHYSPLLGIFEETQEN